MNAFVIGVVIVVTMTVGIGLVRLFSEYAGNGGAVAAASTFAPADEPSQGYQWRVPYEVDEQGQPTVEFSDFVYMRWLRNDGDVVAKGDPVVELETVKASFELECPASGVLKIVAREPDTLKSGDVLAIIG